MSRRAFLQSLTALLGRLALPAVTQTKPDLQLKPATKQWKTLQTSPIAGLQYYHGEALWPQLEAGQMLTLIRESGNPYDNRAVRIDWRGKQLGYIPAIDNAAISQLMDRGERLEAVVVELNQSRKPWERMEVEVRWRA